MKSLENYPVYNSSGGKISIADPLFKRGFGLVTHS